MRFSGSFLKDLLTCLSSRGQLILLLLPVPKSIMMCLFRKKNITVQGSYNSYLEGRMAGIVIGRVE